MDVEFKRRVQEHARLAKVLQRRLAPSQMMDNKRYAMMLHNSGGQMFYPSVAGSAGHYVQPNEEDTDMNIRKELHHHHHRRSSNEKHRQ